MPILIPIVSESAYPASTNFAGSTTITFSLGLLLDATASFNGATDLSITATASQNESVTFSGDTAFFSSTGFFVDFAGDTLFETTAYLNNDPSIFPAASFAGATDFAVAIEFLTQQLAVTFSGASDFKTNALQGKSGTFGFTVFVDILDIDFSNAVYSTTSGIRRYSARMFADLVEIPIIKATVSSPSDRLGTELSVTLAEANVHLINKNQVINFEIGLWVLGAWVWVNVFRDGKLSGRGARYLNDNNLPKDSVGISFVDVMGDRWNRAPWKQITLYDPLKIDPPSDDVLQAQTIYTEQGAAIPPLFVAIAGMTLKDVLDYAYVTGCKFDKVITNIEYFPIEQVSFTMSGGYDGGARTFLEVFSPIVFVVGNNLWIIDPDAPLPAGLDAINFVASFVTDISDTLPAREATNALLVHLRDDSAGEYFTERLETGTTSSGEFGTDEYTELDTERRIREYRNTATPTRIEREEVVYVKTRTLDRHFVTISIETRTDRFDSLNRNAGYTQKVEMLLPNINDPNNALELLLMVEEQQYIYYSPDPKNPLLDLQNRVETHTRGLILVDSSTQYLGKPYKIPYLDGHKSGYVEPNSEQRLEFGPIRTTIEQLRFNGSQVQYETRVKNHVVNVSDRITIKTLPGSSQIDRRHGAGFRNVLLTIPGTETVSRRVPEFDATNLPARLGLILAKRRLRNLNDPPKETSVTMSFVNLSVRRGSTIQLAGRSESLGTYIIKGTEIEFTAVELNQFVAAMKFNARELK